MQITISEFLSNKKKKEIQNEQKKKKYITQVADIGLF